MSGERLPRAEKDLFSRHSQRIADALELHELDYDTYAVLSFLVDRIEAPLRNGKAVFTLQGLADALRWPHKLEWLRQKLQELGRQNWITIETRRGPQAPWIFRLSGAAIDGERGEFPTNFQPGRPSELEINSNSSADETAAIPVPERVSEASEFPTAFLSREEKRREETETETKNLCHEENKEHLVGKTTEGPRPLIGDEMFPVLLAEAVRDGHITQAEAESRYEFHKMAVRA